jgi:hypothetical protein
LFRGLVGSEMCIRDSSSTRQTLEKKSGSKNRRSRK